MLAVLQFPIADARYFVPQRGARLDRPPWPESTKPPKVSFVRSFGRSVDGRLDTTVDRIDERDFCLARRALRLPKLNEQRIGTDGWAPWPSCAFRRVMADGKVVARVEVGIRSHAPLRDVNGERLRAMAEGILGISSVVAGKQGRLEQQGPRLAELYARGSSRLREATDSTRRLVQAGVPLLLIELGTDERGEWPKEAQFVGKGDVGGCDAALLVLRDHIPIWFVARGDAIDADYLRRLRRRILRLYAEQTALNEILKLFGNGDLPFDPGSPLGAPFEEYLENATGEIAADRWGGLDQSAVVSLFNALVGKVSLAGLSLELERIRDDVAAMVQQYAIGKGAHVTNNRQSGGINIINSGVMEGNLIALKNSTDDKELHAAFDTLYAQVKDLAGRLPPEKSKAAQDDLASLTDEAKKTVPNPTVVNSLVDNLKKAAQNIEDLAGPIAATATIILKLLLHAP